MANIWLGGAETGSISETATPGGGCSVQTANVRTGAYAYRCTSTNAFFDFIIYSKATMYYRFYAYILANPSADNVFWQVINASTGVCTLQLSSTGKIKIRNGSSSGTLLGTSVNSIPLNGWFRVEVKIICGTASNGTIEVKFTDANDAIIETLTFTSLTMPAAAVTGAGYGFRTTAQQIDFDDISEDDAAYPGVGRIIARQPKIGTPTYNAWTKVGSDPYWADTPFNTANRATSVNSGIPSRQTKLIAAFNATQTGHGNQTIGANDILNTAAIYYVAKRGTGTAATYAMNFIYNSVLTENAVLLTTTDDYYYSHINSALTIALLNAMEAGGKQTTAGTVLMTIEDLWVIVDYKPVVITPTDIQKNLKYAVKTTPAAKSKSLQYAVKTTPSAKTKLLKYAVIIQAISAKTLKYAIKITPSAKTKPLKYAVKITPSALTKFLKYVLQTQKISTKSLKYVIKTTPSAKTKPLKYAIKTTPDFISKTLKYGVIRSFSDVKTLKYSVLTENLLTKSLIYVVENPIPPWIRPHGMYDFMALKVRGKLGNVATFEEQWWGRQVSPPFVPYNPKTYYQQSWRSVFMQGVDNWHGFSDVIKNGYREKAKDLTMTGFNYYLSQYLNANYPPW